MNTKLLLESNNQVNQNFEIKNGKVTFLFEDEEFTLKTIKKIVAFVKGLLNRYKKNQGLLVDFAFKNRIYCNNKVTYVLFECICYYLIENGFNVKLNMLPIPVISADGMITSPLYCLNSIRDTKQRNSEYKEKFYLDINRNKYRRIIDYNKDSFNIVLSKVTTDIKIFINQHFENYGKRTCSQLINCISELIGNALEHSNSKCLVDIDISENYRSRNKDDNNNYYALNIVIMDISNINFGDLLKEKIQSENDYGEKYKELSNVYEKHKDYFNDKYTENDFFDLASMQDKISGRKYKTSGGTGLKTIINVFKERSSNEICFMLSGDRILVFDKELLETNERDWIGFNKENDFYKQPSTKMFKDSPIYFAGTAFNFIFILKKEENNGK